jgi:hypothetical protein
MLDAWGIALLEQGARALNILLAEAVGHAPPPPLVVVCDLELGDDEGEEMIMEDLEDLVAGVNSTT